MYIREIEGTVGYELTDEGKRFILERVTRAEQKARRQFAKVHRWASRAGAEAEVRARAWACRKDCAEERIKEIGERAYREAEYLIWIREALREDADNLENRADQFGREGFFVELAVEKAGEQAAEEIGLDPDDWWKCGYYEGDDEDDESA